MEIPLNRLLCSDCKAFRAIQDFPFDSRGYRVATCQFCKNRRSRRREKDVLRVEKKQHKASVAQEREKAYWHIKREEYREVYESQENPEESAKAAWIARFDWPPWESEDEYNEPADKLADEPTTDEPADEPTDEYCSSCT